MDNATTSGWVAAYERWLRIEPGGPKADVMRARAVYICGWAFVLLQVMNLVAMTMTYGELTLDHGVSLVAIGMVMAAVHSLRFSKNFAALAGFFSILLLLGIFVSASEGSTGINSALLPLLISGPMINGMVSGWRMSVFFAAMATGLLVLLFSISEGSGSFLALDPAWYETRSTQRGIQCFFALVLMTAISSIFSYHMHTAFDGLERAAKEARIAEDSKAAFLANMSHELRTPLNGIIGMMDLLHTSRLSDDQRRLTKLAATSGRSLVTLVDDILSYALLEAEQDTLEQEPFSLRHILGSIIELQTPNAEAKSISLDLQVDDALPDQLVGDAGRLRQVFVNLVGNAIKFTNEGSVKVSAGLHMQQGGEVTFHISVKDTGVGIARSDIARVFDGFGSAKKSEDGAHQSAGLGLAISKRIVSRMGGKITVDSTINVGSTFSVRLTLPLAEQQAGDTQAQTAA